jgi:phytoene synthase
MPCWRGRVLGHNAALAPPIAAPELTLEDCYAHCREIVRVHSKSFFLSSRFLPPAKRRAVWAVYAFCRTADDIADRAGDPDERLAAIDAWETQLRAAYDGRASGPIFTAFADAAGHYDLPLQAALDLLRGSRMDIGVNRYASYDELSEYCYLVASTVGLLMMPVLGSSASDAPEYAITLGRAMQLTNIVRDVGEDARMGRIYLPAEELAFFRYTEDDLFAGVIDDRFRALMRFQIERARRLYAEAEPGIAQLAPESRYAVRLALHLYRTILDAVEANGFDVFTKRAYVSMYEKVRAAVMLGLRR